MKKLLITSILCLFIFLLSGCVKHQSASADSDKTFITIETSLNPSYDIVYHKDTKVMYAVSHGHNNAGNFTLLVNPDGTPMLYEAESEDKEWTNQ